MAGIKRDQRRALLVGAVLGLGQILSSCGDAGDPAEDADAPHIVAEDPGSNCVAEGDACDLEWPEATPPTIPEPTRCPAEVSGREEALWLHDLRVEDCPHPPCFISPILASAAPDGSLQAAGFVHRGDFVWAGNPGHGVWRARYDKTGKISDAVLDGFRVGHLGAQLPSPPIPLGYLDDRLIWFQYPEYLEEDAQARVGTRRAGTDRFDPSIVRAAKELVTVLQPAQRSISIGLTLSYGDDSDSSTSAPRYAIARYGADGALIYSRSDLPEAAFYISHETFESGAILFQWATFEGAFRMTAFDAQGAPMWTRSLQDPVYFVRGAGASLFAVSTRNTFTSQFVTALQVTEAGEISWAVALPDDGNGSFSADGEGGLLVDFVPTSADGTAERGLYRISADGTCKRYDLSVERTVCRRGLDNCWDTSLTYVPAAGDDELYVINEGAARVGRIRLEETP